ncbi:hypothetical protein L6452_09306 [Arctium lappa]|uniref:Uncharacterized protein n=1 Tax=Arctium lappa TaxID=4217 RepID=A0ACB9DJN6_ARCLA|nr:hypothetical protein L6452_09306 [Arctium lappa]
MERPREPIINSRGELLIDTEPLIPKEEKTPMFPVALAVFTYECVKLYKESKKRKSMGNTDSVCGTVGGFLGSGGGFILGPLLLEIGVIPQVASATTTFVMMFSSSLSVVEFYLLDRFPIPHGIISIIIII